ncbi:hypothetical protein O181_068721, partial [Austropuccinia psidii MF-1]|nr:hypothetical protein [Austropuccinia psidii MF-1]
MVRGTLRPLLVQIQCRQPPTSKARWVPNHKWAQLSQIWPPIPPIPHMAKRTQDPNLPLSTPGL